MFDKNRKLKMKKKHCDKKKFLNCVMNEFFLINMINSTKLIALFCPIQTTTYYSQT